MAERSEVDWWRSLLAPVPCVGLAPDEVDRVEAAHGLPLPAAYRAFLSVAGRRCGSVWVGTDAYFPELLDVRDGALALLAECGAVDLLGPDDVVIGLHQGYELLCLRGREDDPPVFHYLEGADALDPVADRFSGFLVSCLVEAGHDVAG
ncbi:MAG TPA: SMI1/KNR4 family protein [Acidimicrobiales bacterium]|nr:SMI1/KNR4 family protein [Acidimicrobiales bacterium]